jgi:hypothetical protein
VPDLHSVVVNSYASPVPPGGGGGVADSSFSGRSHSEELVCIYKMGGANFFGVLLLFYKTCGVMSECLSHDNFLYPPLSSIFMHLLHKYIKLTHTGEVECVSICPFHH